MRLTFSRYTSKSKNESSHTGLLFIHFLGLRRRAPGLWGSETPGGAPGLQNTTNGNLVNPYHTHHHTQNKFGNAFPQISPWVNVNYRQLASQRANKGCANSTGKGTTPKSRSISRHGKTQCRNAVLIDCTIYATLYIKSRVYECYTL